MTDSVALLKRKNMIVKFLIDREFIIFFIQNEAQTHVAQEVPVDDFISGSLVSALIFPGREESRRVSPRPTSAMAQSRLARVRCGAELAGRVKCGPEQARASRA